MALAPALLERIVGASGIASFVSAAAPPLGQTARLLVALGLAGLGGVVGLLLGRLLAARQRRATAGHKVVYASSDEEAFEEEAEDGESAPRMGLRDRLSRLTGQGDGPRDFDDLPKLRARDRHPDAPGRKPLSPSDDLVAEDSAVLETLAEDVETTPIATAPPAAHSGEAAPLLADAGTAPAPFEAPTDRADAVVADEVSAGEELLELEVVAAAEAPLPPVAHAAVQALAPPVAEAALESLGVVQLTERLAIAMCARRARDAARVAAGEAPAEIAQAEERPIVLPSLVTMRPPQPAPAAPEEPETGEAELDGAALETGYSSLLGLSRQSLHKGPIRADAVRVGEPASAATQPVAVFPGPAGNPTGPFSAPSAAAPFAANGRNGGAEPEQPAMAKVPATGDPAENYRALKAALASLQRISGTR